MAVEQRQAIHRWCHIDLDLLKALYQYDILQNASRWLAIHIRELEAVPM